MARTHQMHGSTTSQSISSSSSEGSPSPPPDSNVASITSTSPILSVSGSGYIPGTTIPITTMAFHSVSSGLRPPSMVPNPLYGPIPTPTMGFHSMPTSEPERYTTPRVTPTPLTTASVLSLRQQMDESNHDMVNLLTQQIGTVFNPLIQNTNDSYQMLAYQMGRIADFFGTPSLQNQPRINHVAPQMILPAMSATPINPRPPYVIPQVTPQQEPVPMTQEEYQYQNEVNQPPPIVMVRRNQDPDDVVRNVQNNNNFAAPNNLATLVETILNQNGLNTGTRRPNFVSALSEYVLQTELPRGWKVPKYTKFAGDTNESTVEHIARYLAESGNLANNENLRMKYFPNSLTKNAFTWFTTLPPNSIHNWTQLERLFHEQFYMGQTKISLKELASVKRKTQETVDDYLNRFRLLKARCFTSVPEHELVEMAAGGLDYSIRKKLDTQYLRDMSQLADRVRQIERLKAEKARNSRFQKKKEINLVESFDDDYEDSDECLEYDESEVNVAELKPGPPYMCKSLRPSNGKNPIEPKNDKFITKTYTFDITKCDEIFDLLVTDGQIVVPKDLKIPPIEQRKKRGYCKFHNYLGHKTYQCVLFRDVVQKAINEGRLKFADKSKPPMKVDTDPLPKADATYVEIYDCNMVDVVDPAPIKAVPEEEYEKKIQEVYPNAEEELVDFLNRCKLNNSEVMLCPRCSAVCDKEATAGLRNFVPYAEHKRKWHNAKPDHKGWPHKKVDWSKSVAKTASIHQRLGPQRTFKPSNKVSVNRWVGGQYVAVNKKQIEGGSSSNVNVKIVAGNKSPAPAKVLQETKAESGANKFAYRNNFKGKNPMTRTQWRRFQRKKKMATQNVNAGGNATVVQKVEMARRPAKERLSPVAEGNENEEDYMDDDDLLDDEPDFDVLVNVISILPAEYDVESEVNEIEDDLVAVEMANHKLRRRTKCCFRKARFRDEKPSESFVYQSKSKWRWC
ncbi:hypothetical protein P8452_08296 [Trifolium repens]|nr:hypothetical protein P8452_08296 [Trifolium repens]